MFRFIRMLSIHARDFFQHCVPSNRLLAATRTRQGLKWGVPAMLVAVPYLPVVDACTIPIDCGSPSGSTWSCCGVAGISSIFFNGPVSLFCLVRAVTRESVTNQAVRLQGRRRVPTNSGS